MYERAGQALFNTVVIVEHDEETIRAADYVVDLGPGAGEHGGYLVAAGTPIGAVQLSAIAAASASSARCAALAGARMSMPSCPS